MEKISERSDSKVYEIGYILLSSIPEEKVSSEVDSLKAMLVKRNAAIIAEGEPLLKALTYTMVKKIGAVNRRFNQGYFGWIKFEMAPEETAAVNKWLLETESILRSILITTVRENTMVSEKLALEAAEAEEAAKDAAEEAAKSTEKSTGDLSA